jgi:hypothetical protein
LLSSFCSLGYYGKQEKEGVNTTNDHFSFIFPFFFLSVFFFFLFLSTFPPNPIAKVPVILHAMSGFGSLGCRRLFLGHGFAGPCPSAKALQILDLGSDREDRGNVVTLKKKGSTTQKKNQSTCIDAPRGPTYTHTHRLTRDVGYAVWSFKLPYFLTLRRAPLEDLGKKTLRNGKGKQGGYNQRETKNNNAKKKNAL